MIQIIKIYYHKSTCTMYGSDIANNIYNMCFGLDILTDEDFEMWFRGISRRHSFEGYNIETDPQCLTPICYQISHRCIEAKSVEDLRAFMDKIILDIIMNI